TSLRSVAQAQNQARPPKTLAAEIATNAGEPEGTAGKNGKAPDQTSPIILSRRAPRRLNGLRHPRLTFVTVPGSKLDSTPQQISLGSQTSTKHAPGQEHAHSLKIGSNSGFKQFKTCH